MNKTAKQISVLLMSLLIIGVGQNAFSEATKEIIHDGNVLNRGTRKGLYKNDGKIIILKNNKSCGVPCIYKDLSEEECLKLGKSFDSLGGGTRVCHDKKNDSWTQTNKTTSLPGTTNTSPKISWQKCDTFEQNTCPIIENNFNHNNTFSQIQNYQKSKIHNFKLIASPSPLTIEKCLPRA